MARADFVVPAAAEALTIWHAAPLLCAGIIGFRSLRVAGVRTGRAGGVVRIRRFGALGIAVLQAWNCEVYRQHARRIAPQAG